MKILIKILCVTLLLGPLATNVIAQSDAETTDAVTVAIPIEKDQVPEDALNRGTPRRSAIGFLEACAQFDYEKAAQYLDLRNLPEDVAAIGGHELARQLNHVLSRSV